MRIVTRAEWGAKSRLPKERMNLPVAALVLHHTVTDVTADPAADMREVEQVGVDRFGQLSYSYCVHPDGTILEGCADRVGAHTAKRNSTTFGVALIGNYQTREVDIRQVNSVRWLIAELQNRNLLRLGMYPTAGHRDLASTACPGDRAYALLDAMRVPWTEPIMPTTLEEAMANHPELADIEGPLTFHPVINTTAGESRGYYIFSTATGELHTWGPGAVFFGRSEDPTPDDQQ